MSMSEHLEAELDSAINNSAGIHSTNIRESFTPLFIRVAKAEPEALEPVIDILLNNMEVHRSNVVDSLYILIRIAGASKESRDQVKKDVNADLITHYSEDEDINVRTNAHILQQVLNGEDVEQFLAKEPAKPKPQPTQAPTIYNLVNSNLAINSPSTTQELSVNYSELPAEIREKLDELDKALQLKNKTKTVKILTYLADKAFDVLVAVLAGTIIKK